MWFLLPAQLRASYEHLVLEDDEEVTPIVKAADKLSAYIKCVEEQKAGNTEFDSAAWQTRKALEAMNSNLCSEYDKVDLETSAMIEKEINQYRDQLRATHLEAIKAGSYNYQTGMAYSGMYALYEKTADFIINVSEAIK